ncbi:protein CHUP1, chloroplastic isoform X1 [Elaeis guineensis]|uniref:Protein CHUP1, chloroplastic n=1 Tax=Elaeis guineensis var. tenera TaxID=51953 RepID=A0A6I9S4R1_ELAGV|nr:protein CHUP1, chloroplastic [Elaeis guineensis]
MEKNLDVSPQLIPLHEDWHFQNLSMEREKKRKEDIKPLLLLLKVAIPLAFPLAGFILSTLTTNSRTERTTQPSCPPQEQMDNTLSNSQYEHGEDERSHGLNTSSMYQEKGEDEPEKREPSVSLHDSSSLEVTRVRCSNNVREISIKQSQDGPNLEEDIETLKSQIAALQEKEHEFDSQIYQYCNLREQESAIQKLQIMCLGFKLESLEAQNQRLEDTIVELREGMKQYDMMTDVLGSLQRKVKKLHKTNRLHSRLIHRQSLDLDAREVELSMAKQELKQATKEIKDLADQLHQDNKAMEEKPDQTTMMNPSASKDKQELVIEDDGSPQLSKKELLDQLELFREQWYADMEEMIYLGWIGACLRYEILINQKEEDQKPVGEVGDHLVMELPIEDRPKNCITEFHDSDCSSLVADVENAGLDVALVKHHSGSTKPRLLHKIKGWAKGKGRSKRWCDRDRSSSERWCGPS